MTIVKFSRIVAIPFALLATACQPDAYSRGKSQEILNRFEDAVPVIDRFRREHGLLPTDSELNALLGTSDHPFRVMISSKGFESCDHDLPQFRKAKQGSYVLAIWRGEWLECYDPNTKTSSP